MNYSAAIPPDERGSFRSIPSWQTHYDSFRADYMANQDPAQFNHVILKIENAVFPNSVFFSRDYECHLEFSNCYFMGQIVFYEARFLKAVMMRQCFLDKEMRFQKTVSFLDKFDIADLKCPDQIIVSGGEFEECNWSFKDYPRLLFHGGNFKNLNVGYWGGTELSDLTINAMSIKGLVRITGEKSRIKKILLYNQSLELSVAFENFHVNTFSIYQFRNDKSLRLVNICPLAGEHPSEISICESYMGKAEFYNVNLSTFEKVNIYNAHMIDCSFVNITWKNKIYALKGRSIYKTEDDKTLEQKLDVLETRALLDNGKSKKLLQDPLVVSYNQKLREVYRQLKYSLSKQGDIIGEQKFHSKEMQVYYDTLNWQQEKGTKTIIKLSHLFSDFGQSISRPLVALGFGHLALFLILLMAGGVNGLKISVCDPTWDGFVNGFNWFIKLMNPLRKGDELPGLYIAIDFTMRIWASFMIYNFIRASRRFIK